VSYDKFIIPKQNGVGAQKLATLIRNCLSLLAGRTWHAHIFNTSLSACAYIYIYILKERVAPQALFKAQFTSVSHITIAPNGINSYMQTTILLQPTKTHRHQISPPGGLNIRHIIRLPPGQALRSCTSCFQFARPCFQPRSIFADVQ
jgi:hypothetical protein